VWVSIEIVAPLLAGTLAEVHVQHCNSSIGKHLRFSLELWPPNSPVLNSIDLPIRFGDAWKFTCTRSSYIIWLS